MDVFQLLVAATRSAQDNDAGKLKTQTLSSEIVYNLSPTNNVSTAWDDMQGPMSQRRKTLTNNFVRFLFFFLRTDCRVSSTIRHRRDDKVLGRDQDWW